MDTEPNLRRWNRRQRGPKHRFLTELVRELGLGRPARILDCTGERAEESPARARKPPL
nr:hypothetical protein GCM10020241_08420 [Streptoalloteichus tenebrarius]